MVVSLISQLLLVIVDQLIHALLVAILLIVVSLLKPQLFRFVKLLQLVQLLLRLRIDFLKLRLMSLNFLFKLLF